MNSLLIEKLIKSNNITCPEFINSNPLLDKNITKALSRSLINILKISSQNSNINNSLRLSVLKNIRKLCTDHPENHLKIDENVTELLISFYEKQIEEFIRHPSDIIDRDIDKFFIANHKELNLNSSSRSNMNPEIIQALLNLSNKKYLEFLSDAVVQWNIEDPRYLILAKELWNNKDYMEESLQSLLSIKIKSEIEEVLLKVSHHVLENKITDFESILSNFNNFNSILNVSSKSGDCFQICCKIFNFVFVSSNFDPLIQKLIQGFVNKVKVLLNTEPISTKYPSHLTHLIVLLDIDISNFPLPIRESYVQTTLTYLRKLQSREETDLIMLLSHYPDWFDIYFS